MNRKVIVAVVTVALLGTIQADAQIFRRYAPQMGMSVYNQPVQGRLMAASPYSTYNQYANQQQSSSCTCQQQQQRQQASMQAGSIYNNSNVYTPATAVTQAMNGQRYSVYYNTQTGQTVLRPILRQPVMARSASSATNQPISGQVDMARQPAPSRTFQGVVPATATAAPVASVRTTPAPALSAPVPAPTLNSPVLVAPTSGEIQPATTVAEGTLTTQPVIGKKTPAPVAPPSTTAVAPRKVNVKPTVAPTPATKPAGESKEKKTISILNKGK